MARDTGGRGAKSQESASTATAAEVQPAPGNQATQTVTRTRERGEELRGTSKPGRPFSLLTPIPPAKPSDWYKAAGPVAPCRHCGGRLISRVERGDGTACIRVSHRGNCEAKA